jgi:type II secretory pathway predicted ATPase ExeA/predicted  nucleic acid-binding Zn-ribbon protein
VAKALENPGGDPTYLEFFGFTRPPFARLSKPAQIFHTEQYSLLMAHLAAATEQPDCLVVVCGADGSGKTTLLNRYITSLGDDVCFATIDETCKGEKEFYTAFLRQLGFSEITGTSPELWRITKEFLVHRGMAGEPVLMMIDNAHLISPNVLEQLRRMSAIKVNSRRVLSMVLAGTSDLDRIMESPAMSQVKFDSQVHFNIRVYTEEETANYVWHRLRLAGGSDVVSFANEAHPLIYRYTGGIPKLINMLCNDLLTEAFARESHEITEELVRHVADDRKLLPHVVPLQGKGRRKTDPDFKLMQPDEITGERITPRDSAAKGTIEKKRKSRRKKSSAGDTNLLEQISELSQQVGELRTDRMQALEEMGIRDKENTELRARLETQTAEAEKLAATVRETGREIERLKKALADNEKALQKSEKTSKRLSTDLNKERKAAKAAQTAAGEKFTATVEDHKEEVEQLKKALSDSMKALQKSEKTSDKLTSDLEKQRKAVHAAEADTSKASSRIEKLTSQNSELKDNISKLETDLKEAEQRDTSALEEEIEKKEDELTALRDELESRDESISDLENQFKEIQKECASLRLRVAARKTLEESVSEKESRIADLQAQLDSQSDEIEKLKKKHASADSRDGRESPVEQIETLETELHEARKMLTGIQEQLTGSEEILPEAESEASDEPEIEADDEPEQEIESSDEPKLEFAESIDAATELEVDEEAASQIEVEEISLDDEVSEIFLESGADKVAAENDETINAPRKETKKPAAGTAIVALEVFKDGKSKQVFKIPEGEQRIMIGRSEDSELRLKSEFVSRHHALIVCADDGLYIEDLNIFNGTLVNSEKVSRRKLQLDDTIMIGKFEIKPKAA